MPSSAPANRGFPGSVIPDYCNTGILFRALVAINAVVLMGAILRTHGWTSGFHAFIEAAVLVEMAALASMFALCAMRRSSAALDPGLQRLTGVLVPTLVTGVLAFLLQPIVAPVSPYPHFFVLKATLAAALSGAALQHYFELRARASSPALAEARLQALQARIRPHFLFNSLNAVLSLIRSDPRKAEATLEDLSDLFRVLFRDARDLTTLADEIALCEQYLAIEKLRLGERLSIKWDTDGMTQDVLRKAQVPSLLLQPLLENAVHHGIEPATGSGIIQIRITKVLDRIEITVINPYHGASASSGNQMALDNVRERLSLLYDVEAQLITQITQDKFLLRLRFPYRKVV